MFKLSEFEHYSGIRGDACLTEIYSTDNADQSCAFNENNNPEILKEELKLYATL